MNDQRKEDQVMRIIIVDDEELARDRLRRFIEEQGEHQVIAEASSGIEALEKIDAMKPDLILLDIRMPGMDGMEVAGHLLDMEEAPAIVFVTAYDEYALEAFRVQAVDYLLKPIKADRLYEAFKAAAKLNKRQFKELNQQEDGTVNARTHISSRTRQGIALVPVHDILYFRAEHKYVTVRHVNGEVLIEEPLKDLESEFADRFLRVHRNCLVAKDKLQALEKNEQGQPCIRLRDLTERLEVSRRHLPKVRQIMTGG